MYAIQNLSARGIGSDPQVDGFTSPPCWLSSGARTQPLNDLSDRSPCEEPHACGDERTGRPNSLSPTRGGNCNQWRRNSLTTYSASGATFGDCEAGKENPTSICVEILLDRTILLDTIQVKTTALSHDRFRLDEFPNAGGCA